jgi:hypothetical protein
MLRRLFNWYGKRTADAYAVRVKQSISDEEWNELVELARRCYQSDPTFRVITQSGLGSDGSAPGAMSLPAEANKMWGGPELEAILSPERVLANPLLTPYRRPALRLLPAAQREILNLTPILLVPRFNFNAFASKFKNSDRKFVQLPFGFVFGLRCIAEIALGLYKNDTLQERRHDYFEALSVLAAELSGPTLNLYVNVFSKLGRKARSRPSLPVIQCAHVMGIFLLLHEFGHVGLDHWIPPSVQKLSTQQKERLRSQELGADEFAARCILRAPKGMSVPWDDVREMHSLFILMLLLTLETHCRVRSLKVPEYYPSFSERSQSLISTLEAPPRLRASIRELASQFAVAKAI